jgi:competence protein ComEA
MLRVCSFVFVLAGLLSTGVLAQAPAPKAAPAAAEKTQVINLNTATAAELEQLPGIGAKVAARIVDYRSKKGPFKKVEELMNVQGIGEKSFLKLRSRLTVGATSAPSQQ